MEIRIGGYLAASMLLEREPGAWHALVLLDSGLEPTEFVAEQTRSHLFLRFDDVEGPQGSRRPPNRAQIAQALEFAAGKDRLLVSCRAGRGRSVATAYLIACREHGVAEALKLLDPTRHRPNRLVVSLGQGLPGMPDVLGPFNEWRRQSAHVQLSDHYGEVEREFEAMEARGGTNRICVRRGGGASSQ